MRERMGRQIILEFARQREFDEELLADAAECCLDALHREAQFIAFGPAISVDLECGIVSVECTIAVEDEADVQRTSARLSAITLAALAAAEYSSSTVTRQAVPA